MFSKSHNLPYILVIALILVGGLIIPLAATAGPINYKDFPKDKFGWFYNMSEKPSRDVMGDYRYCKAFGEHMFSGQEPDETLNNQYGATGFVMYGLASSGGIRAFTDDCMIAKGYVRYITADSSQKEFLKRYENMTQAQRLDLAGATIPSEGIKAREWANSYWLPLKDQELVDYKNRSFEPKKVYRKTIEKVKPVWFKSIKSGYYKASSADTVLMPDESIISFAVKNKTAKPITLRFRRDDYRTGGPSIIDYNNNPTWFILETVTKPGKTEYSYVVPAGTYSLAAISDRKHIIKGTVFCYGTIATRVSSGQRTDLGIFTVGQASKSKTKLSPKAKIALRIDRREIETVPEKIPVQIKAVNAEFENGFPSVCNNGGGGAAWGFDIPNAPRWNSAH